MRVKAQREYKLAERVNADKERKAERERKKEERERRERERKEERERREQEWRDQELDRRARRDCSGGEERVKMGCWDRINGWLGRMSCGLCRRKERDGYESIEN